MDFKLTTVRACKLVDLSVAPIPTCPHRGDNKDWSLRRFGTPIPTFPRRGGRSKGQERGQPLPLMKPSLLIDLSVASGPCQIRVCSSFPWLAKDRPSNLLRTWKSCRPWPSRSDYPPFPSLSDLSACWRPRPSSPHPSVP